MDVHQKVENIHNQQQQQPEPQSKPNATYHFDDASQKYAYGESFVGGTGAGQVSPRLPLVSGIPDLIALIDVSTSSVGGMSQGPPPDNFVDPSPPVNQSEQSLPHHQSPHNSLPPASQQSQQPQQVPVALPPGRRNSDVKRTHMTHSREISESFLRASSIATRMFNPNKDVLTGKKVPPSAVVTPTTSPEIVAAGVVPAPVVMAADEVEASLKEIAPVFSETKEMAPSPTGVSTTNPDHPSSAPQALPYTGLNQFQQPRAAQPSYGYRQTPPYPSFPMQSSPAVPQQLQPQQSQQQPQQQKEQQPQQQPEQPQQVPVGPPPTTQPRESSGASLRLRSSALRDHITNRDVKTGEEVPPSAVVTPPTSPEIARIAIRRDAEETEVLIAYYAMRFLSEMKEMALSQTENTDVPLIDEIKAEEKTVLPTVVEQSPPHQSAHHSLPPASQPEVLEKTPRLVNLLFPFIMAASNSSIREMSQGPPPDNLVDPSPVDQSEQSPPQSAHHSLPPASQQPQQPQKDPVPQPPTAQSRKSSESASLEVNQELAVANPEQPGGPIMQGRPTHGNNHLLGRLIRPGNQHMPRLPITGGTMYSNYLSNAPWALPYRGLNQQPLRFVIGDQFNQKSPPSSLYAVPANPPAYYTQSGNLPPEKGNVSEQQPRAGQQSNAYRQTPPYPSSPMQSSPAVPQQPQSQQQQQPQQQKEQQPQQQPEQPQQVPVAPPPITQPRKSSGASRRARSSSLCIVDPSTNRDLLNGEEVHLAVVASTTSPEIAATGVVSAPVMAADEVEESLTATPFISPTENTNVSLIGDIKAEEKTVPTVVAASPNMASYKEIGNTGIKYSRENLLGQGNFGDVYRGIYNDEQVAVKKLLLNRYEKEEREVDLQKNLNHENVLKIRKVEEDDDFKYIVLELCAGTLLEVIDKTYKGPAYPSDPIVLYQIADGLDYIHSQKLIHRDIKPENILISMNGQQLKLSDFGLSKQISIRDTCSMSGMKGTLLWMAPELRGDDNSKATPKCDVFPCGCVFFVFLTRENGGIHPFGDMKDHVDVQLNIRSDKPINIDKLKADHYAVPVIQEMIKANPLERINLANVKERLRPFSHPDLRPSTTVESVKSTSLNYKDDQRIPVNPEMKKTYDRSFILELQNNLASQKKPEGLPSLEVVRDKASTKMKRGISVGDFARSFTE